MLIHPHDLKDDQDRLEEIEEASLRMVVQAIIDFRNDAVEIFQEESDLVADIGEDITREALDRMGMSKIDQRLFGKMD
ncbi:SfiI family type II restriction endonuclease, partial [bacterium]|nr:SfiI family type II restriction endonuclease [bacterium]